MRDLTNAELQYVYGAGGKSCGKGGSKGKKTRSHKTRSHRSHKTKSHKRSHCRS